MKLIILARYILYFLWWFVLFWPKSDFWMFEFLVRIQEKLKYPYLNKIKSTYSIPNYETIELYKVFCIRCNLVSWVHIELEPITSDRRPIYFSCAQFSAHIVTWPMPVRYIGVTSEEHCVIFGRIERVKTEDRRKVFHSECANEFVDKPI